MNDDFTIYIDRLAHGKTEPISFITSPKFLHIDENDLVFQDPVEVEGKAYIADSHLVLNIDIYTTCDMPCSLCNKRLKQKVNVIGHYITIPLEEVRGKSFEFSENAREALLLEVPLFGNCDERNCPEKNTINQYLKKDTNDTNYPFADLEC